MKLVLIRCRFCQTRNRIDMHKVGVKELRCGNCKGPVPTPFIKDELIEVHKKLQTIAIISGRAGYSAEFVRLELDRQKLIIAHAEVHYPGFKSTIGASRDLIVEMQVVVHQIEERLKRRGAFEEGIKAILVLLLRMIRIQVSVPRALPPGLMP